MITVTKSMINTMNGDLYKHLMSTRIYHWQIVKDIHMSSKHYEEIGYNLDDLVTYLNQKRKEKITPVLNTGMNASPLALY